MKNITLAINEELLRSARIYAAERGTTVNALVRDYLTSLVDFEKKAAKARKRLGQLSEQSKGRLDPDWKWNREDAYEGRLFPRHEHSDLRGFGEGSAREEEEDSS